MTTCRKNMIMFLDNTRQNYKILRINENLLESLDISEILKNQQLFYITLIST